MGYRVTDLDRVVELDGYYFILMGNEHYTYNELVDFLYRKFDEISIRIGRDSAIVKGDKFDLLFSLKKYLIKMEWLDELYCNICKRDGLIIMKPHPCSITKRFCFYYIPFEYFPLIYEKDYQLLNDIIALCENDDETIFRKIENVKKGGSLMEVTKKSIILKPSWMGIGMDLNEILNKRRDNIHDIMIKKDS